MQIYWWLCVWWAWERGFPTDLNYFDFRLFTSVLGLVWFWYGFVVFKAALNYWICCSSGKARNSEQHLCGWIYVTKKVSLLYVPFFFLVLGLSMPHLVFWIDYEEITDFCLATWFALISVLGSVWFWSGFAVFKAVLNHWFCLFFREGNEFRANICGWIYLQKWVSLSYIPFFFFGLT